ncbi:MAG: bifunctional riboflavin kinase/FAD synthetase [Deltaproteobacteria bacterium]|jgi:riboflavin kinase/FMN adenylyltransferase|nr:bifunctional riboflavin kinase/FAD synthetase [Deltaproteobacteria bacterium]MBW2478922.1 bifunctional riboflavin kinase/FAD synthetase [Deltaproteobacteria bacterium]
MKIFDHLDKIREPFKNAVITIGNFDGVHIGHQALFHEVIEKAEAIDGTSIAMTFEPHPIRVLKQNGHPPLITLYEQKAELIERTGIDVLICVPFNKAFASMSAHQFITDLLVKRIGMKAIVVGKDYSFGKNREGTIDMMKSYAPDYGFEVIVANWIKTPLGSAGRISSTRIRELVIDGQMTEAEKMLGRNYQIRGRVVTGRDRGGKLLGIPTANINLHDELCPKTGIYAVTVEIEDRQYNGVANIGYSPTFEDHEFTVEVHILDFNANIYGEKIRVNFIKRIRDEIKFSNISELIEQIKMDIAAAREIFSK